MHILHCSNARAIASLWQRFVRYLREGCWDRGRLLPCMTAPPTSSSCHHSRLEADSAVSAGQGRAAAGLPRPDFSFCLLHQKLQMLNLCIQQAHQLPCQQQDPESSQVHGPFAFVRWHCHDKLIL